MRYLPLHPGTAELADRQREARHDLEATEKRADAGRFTPSTGLWVTAFASQRCSKSEESAASLRRMMVPLNVRPSKSFGQASTCARTDYLEAAGALFRPAEDAPRG